MSTYRCTLNAHNRFLYNQNMKTIHNAINIFRFLRLSSDYSNQEKYHPNGYQSHLAFCTFWNAEEQMYNLMLCDLVQNVY